MLFEMNGQTINVSRQKHVMLKTCWNTVYPWTKGPLHRRDCEIQVFKDLNSVQGSRQRVKMGLFLIYRCMPMTQWL